MNIDQKKKWHDFFLNGQKGVRIIADLQSTRTQTGKRKKRFMEASLGDISLVSKVGGVPNWHPGDDNSKHFRFSHLWTDQGEKCGTDQRTQNRIGWKKTALADGSRQCLERWKAAVGSEFDCGR